MDPFGETSSPSVEFFSKLELSDVFVLNIVRRTGVHARALAMDRQ